MKNAFGWTSRFDSSPDLEMVRQRKWQEAAEREARLRKVGDDLERVRKENEQESRDFYSIDQAQDLLSFLQEERRMAFFGRSQASGQAHYDRYQRAIDKIERGLRLAKDAKKIEAIRQHALHGKNENERENARRLLRKRGIGL